MVADFASHLADGDLFIIESNTSIGYSVHRLENGVLFVENIAIHPDHQGGGTGREVLNQIGQAARLEGASRIDLYTNAKMTEALAFYDRLLFRITDRRVEDGFDRIYLTKDL